MTENPISPPSSSEEKKEEDGKMNNNSQESATVVAATPSDEPKRAPTPVEDLPKHPVLVLQMTKTGGITLPKELRESFQTNIFAFWESGNKLMLQPIAEEDLQHLDLADKKKKEEGEGGEKKPRERKKKEGGGDTKTPKVKKATGPQPELARYFQYEFEKQPEVSAALESAFYKFAEEPPKIQEGLDRVKYALITFLSGKSVNDSRLRNSVVNFLCDVAERLNIPDAMTFAEEKILDHIKSEFLLEQSLNTLIITSGKTKNFENLEKFLIRILKLVDRYPDNELFKIKQLFTNLIRAISREKIELTDKMKLLIFNKMLDFMRGFTTVPSTPEDKVLEHKPLDSTTILEFIDHIEKLKMIEKAHSMTEELLARLPPEDREIEKVREKLRNLSAKPI
jgi:bifunctional DNA-binding transcriptional regulator/antitoxin component of YhaV-PrlF toxin-antitoxin module